MPRVIGRRGDERVESGLALAMHKLSYIMAVVLQRGVGKQHDEGRKTARASVNAYPLGCCMGKDVGVGECVGKPSNAVAACCLGLIEGHVGSLLERSSLVSP